MLVGRVRGEELDRLVRRGGRRGERDRVYQRLHYNMYMYVYYL